MNQEVKDWKNHPLTVNFESGVNDAIGFYKDSLSNIDVDFSEREICRRLGVIQGLEALLTYEPEVNEETGEVVTDEV